VESVESVSLWHFYAFQGRRCLIFSQFTMMMDIMEAYLKHRHHKYLRLDGSTPMTERLFWQTSTCGFAFSIRRVGLAAMVL